MDLRALSLISLELSPTLHSQYSLFLSLNHFLKHIFLRLYIQFYFVFLTFNCVKVFLIVIVCIIIIIIM